jgi:hypothetical protein
MQIFDMFFCNVNLLVSLHPKFNMDLSKLGGNNEQNIRNR